MVDESVGLTVTYNRLKDPACTDARILRLRALHEEMDSAVLAAYAASDPKGRWVDVVVPAYCSMNDADRKTLEEFEDAVIDCLFVLNTKRAQEEKLKGLGGPTARTKPKKRPAKPAVPPPKKAAAPRVKKLVQEQLPMVPSDPDAES
jgi:hypothetical protein